MFKFNFDLEADELEDSVSFSSLSLADRPEPSLTHIRGEPVVDQKFQEVPLHHLVRSNLNFNLLFCF
jgi:hypothetical protein